MLASLKFAEFHFEHLSLAISGLMSSSSTLTKLDIGDVTLIAVILVVIIINIIVLVVLYKKRGQESGSCSVNPNGRFLTITMDKFLNDMEREKPIKFTSQQLRIANDNFTNVLGSRGFGAVYKGLFNNGTMVAVKVLYSCSNKRVEEQFIAEVSTLGRVHHLNLVRLYGFCFEANLIALVYEYMGNGSLDRFLFHENKILGFEKLNEIAIGTAKGIAYLHEECQQMIIHYDIKPGNILLDSQFSPKVADFGLAKLCNRENTHVTMTGGRGTPGYTAPELWMPFPITHKCDVYSFGMLLFEILGRRRNLDLSLPDSQEWFPKWVWKKMEKGEMGELMIVCGIEEKDCEMAMRMAKVGLWCVQFCPQSRPLMSIVAQMLEGAVEVPAPLNPFRDLLVVNNSFPMVPAEASFGSGTAQMVTGSNSFVCATPIMRRYEIELASS